jgi:L-asparaginase
MIRIFITGGTFDKDYDELTGSLAFKDSHLPEMLRLGRNRVDVSIRTLMMIDSLEMTAADRSIIVEQCLQAAESRILITHGTDTMIDTAGTIAAALGPATGKTVVLTGAMVPYAFGSSDGLFNLGSAFARTGRPEYSKALTPEGHDRTLAWITTAQFFLLSVRQNPTGQLRTFHCLEKDVSCQT